MPYYESSVPTVVGEINQIQTYFTIVLILAFVLALLIYFLFLKPSNEDKLSGFLKKLYDFLSFKTMTLEAVIKILYLFSALFITIYSLSLISQNFWLFLLTIIIGNVSARLIAEGSLLFLMIYKNTKDIRDSLKSKK